MDVLEESGRLPDDEKGYEASTVTFCRGTSGVIPMLTLASEVFPAKKDRLL